MVINILLFIISITLLYFIFEYFKNRSEGFENTDANAVEGSSPGSSPSPSPGSTTEENSLFTTSENINFFDKKTTENDIKISKLQDENNNLKEELENYAKNYNCFPKDQTNIKLENLIKRGRETSVFEDRFL